MKQIIVLGFYRSGTSMVAGVLDKLGVDMGDFDKADARNPKGYFEDRESIGLNVFLRRKYKKTAVTVNSEDGDKVEQDPSLNKKIKEYIKKRDKKEVWGVKDPKMTMFFLTYLKYLKNPYIIFISRNKTIVLMSFSRHYQRGIDNLKEPYKRHLEMFEKIKKTLKKKKIKYLELEYESCLKNPKREVNRICKFIDVKPNQEAINFIGR